MRDRSTRSSCLSVQDNQNRKQRNQPNETPLGELGKMIVEWKKRCVMKDTGGRRCEWDEMGLRRLSRLSAACRLGVEHTL